MTNKPTGAVLAVVQSFRRPDNIKRVIHALRGQTVPLHIAVVDCSPYSRYAIPIDAAAAADSYWAASLNFGPTARFIPPLALTGYEWTLFCVDDHLPGKRHVEHLLRCGESLYPDCATIGSDGRIIRDGEILKRKGSQIRSRYGFPAGEPMPVDFITSSELCRTRAVQGAIRFRDRLFDDYGSDISLFEDDLILCFGVQLFVRARVEPDATCFLAPESDDPETAWNRHKLPAPHALSARPDHAARRNEFVQKAIKTGFLPLAEKLLAAGNLSAA